MAKGFKHGAGGGAGLNFKVVGNPQPENPRENTIWVDTDKINNYYFSATQPENMVEYDVWFPTGTSSPVAFSATKKNPVMVYPKSAKQMVSGSLVDVTAKSYQGGKWVNLAKYLYNYGDLCTDVTGGWGTKSVGLSAAEPLYPTNPTLTKESNRLVISVPGGWHTGVVWTQKNIDLTDYKTIEVAGYKAGYSANLIVIPENTTYWSTDTICRVGLPTTANSKVSVDVSAVSGSYRVGFGLYSNNDATTMYIDEVVMK